MRLRECGALVAVLLAAMAVAATGSEYAPDVLVVRFRPSTMDPPPGLSGGAPQDFSCANTATADALAAAGVQSLTRLFPNFDHSQVSGTNPIGEPIQLPNLADIYIATMAAGTVIESAAQAIGELPDVMYAEPDFLRQATAVPTDPLFSKQWNLSNVGQTTCNMPMISGADIGATAAWDITTGSSGLRIGVLDTGIESGHADLAGRVELGPTYISMSSSSEDDGGHGTACAGIIAAVANNGIGGAGITWQGKVVAIKVLDSGGRGRGSRSAQGMEWARANGIRIMSMSYGDCSRSSAEADVIRGCVLGGVLPVASMGNNNSNTEVFPAGYREAYAVGAVMGNRNRWQNAVLNIPGAPASCGGTVNGSNFGAWNDISAPGGAYIPTTKYNCSGCFYDLVPCDDGFSGTSAAVPVVAGVAGLILAAYPQYNLLGEEIAEVMNQTAHDVTEYGSGWDQETGWGVVRADVALSYLAAPRTLGRVYAPSLDNVNHTVIEYCEEGDPECSFPIQKIDIYTMRKTVVFPTPFAAPPHVLVRMSGTNGVDNRGWVVPGSLSVTGCTVETSVRYITLQPQYGGPYWDPGPPSAATIALTAFGVQGALAATVNGPDEVNFDASWHTWTAAVSGGAALYSYEWRRKSRENLFWSDVLSTGPQYVGQGSGDDWMIQLTVHSGSETVVHEFCVASTYPPLVPQVSIIGPGIACAGEVAQWHTAVWGRRSCGDFAWAWKWRRPNEAWSPVVSTLPEFGTQVEPGGIEVRVDVTLPGGGTGGATVAVSTVACAISDLYSDMSSESEIWLAWTSPNVLTGNPVEYDLRYAVFPIHEANFDGVPRAQGVPAPAPPGYYEGFGVGGLMSSTTYWFAIKTKDSAGHWSPISNVFASSTMGGGGGWGGFSAREVPVAGAGGRSGRPTGGGETDREGGSARGPVPLIENNARLPELKVGDGSVVTSGRPVPAMALVRPKLAVNAQLALAAEMKLEVEGPVWSVYYVDSTEMAGLVGSDSAAIILQRAGVEGEWRNRLRVRPAEGSWRFAVRGWMRPGRAVFLGNFSLMQAWSAVGYEGSGERAVLEVTSARHSRLGNVTAGVDAAGYYDMGFVPGDTLKLTYGPAADSTESGQNWFLLVGPSSMSAGLGGRRLPGSGEAPPIPAAFALRQNQPNPFDRTTSIRFELPAETRVRLEIFDLQGRLVRTLADAGYPAGFHVLEWDHRTDGGQALGAGVYLYRIQAGSFRDQKKIVLLAR